MQSPLVISQADSQSISSLSWQGAVDALRSGHRLPKAVIKDMQLDTGKGISLNRAASIDGLGLGVKSMTIFKDNASLSPPVPSVQGSYLLFDADTGTPKAMIDGKLITWWKTAADSVLGALLLANPNPKHLLIVGSGTLAASLVEAYSELFDSLDTISIWSRQTANAEKLVHSYQDKLKARHPQIALKVSGRLPDVVNRADIISTATLSSEPVIKGEWVSAGSHVDLIGAYNPSMREADDALISQHKLFVDSRETTINEIGELMIPIDSGVITQESIRADLYDLLAQSDPITGRGSLDEITVYKNGGGAHLDLMIATYLLRAYADQNADKSI